MPLSIFGSQAEFQMEAQLGYYPISAISKADQCEPKNFRRKADHSRMLFGRRAYLRDARRGGTLKES